MENELRKMSENAINAAKAGELLREALVRISEPKQQQDNFNVKTDRQLVDLGIRPPRVYFNNEYHKKLPVEKKMLKRLKSEHKRLLRLNGFDPKKRMNLSGPQTVNFTC